MFQFDFGMRMGHKGKRKSRKPAVEQGDRGGGEEDADSDDLFLRMTAPTNSNIVPGRHLHAHAGGNGHTLHLNRHHHRRTGDEDGGEDEAGGHAQSAPVMIRKNRSPGGMECGDWQEGSANGRHPDVFEVERRMRSGVNGGCGDVTNGDGSLGEEDIVEGEEYGGDASFRLADVIEEVLQESRKLATTSNVHLWACFVRSSLADWHTRIRRRERCRRRLREAEMQRENELREKQRQEMESNKLDMMERIRLLKERALADVARSEANVRLWQSSGPEESRTSAVEHNKNGRRQGGESKIGDKGESALMKPTRKGSAGMLLPKIKLSFSWDKAAPKDRDNREKDKELERDKDRDKLQRGAELPVNSFVVMEEAEEARINKTVKKKRPSSPRLTHALSLLGIGSQPARSRAADASSHGQLGPPLPGNISPPLSPRQAKQTSQQQISATAVVVVEKDTKKGIEEEGAARQSQARGNEQRTIPSQTRDQIRGEDKSKEDSLKQASTSRRRERTKTLGSLLTTKRSEQKQEEKSVTGQVRSSPVPSVPLSRSAGAIPTTAKARVVRHKAPVSQQPAPADNGKSSSVRRLSPRPTSSPHVGKQTSDIIYNSPRPQAESTSPSSRSKRSSTCTSTSTAPSESSRAEPGARQRFFTQPRNTVTTQAARARSPSPPRVAAASSATGSGKPTVRAPSPSSLSTRNRDTSPRAVPVRQRSASVSSTPPALVSSGRESKASAAPAPVKPTPIRPTSLNRPSTPSLQSSTQPATSTSSGGRRAALKGRSSTMPARTRSPSPTTSAASSSPTTSDSVSKSTPRPGSGRTSPSTTADSPDSSNSPSPSSSPTSSSPLSSSPSKPSRFLSALTKSSSSLTVRKAFSLNRTTTSAEKQSTDSPRGSEGGIAATLTRSKSHREVVRDRERSGSRKSSASGRDGATL